MKFAPLICLLLVACQAPLTHNQATSRAVERNCEALSDSAANAVRLESAQVVKEGGSTNLDQKAGIESQAQKAKKDSFKSCMLKYAV
jgi:hypothetical protein